MDRIFVTGMGIISSLGIGVSQTLKALKDEKSGITQLKHLDTIHQLPCGEVDLSEEQLRVLCNISNEATITRTTLLGILAVRQALQSAHFQSFNGKRVAFISGTTVGGMEKSEAYYLDFLNNNKHSDYISAHDCGACTDAIAAYCYPFDFVSTISTACSSATNAIILGRNLIKTDMVDIAVVGGTECLTKFHLNGFNTLMILDKEPCRPFCNTRQGLNLGEGAAYIVIESEESANNRAVSPLCLLTGCGNACDAFHQTASSPDGRGATLSMQAALNDANLKPQQIDYINAHGTATPNNDESESAAIINVFTDKHPLISSTKAHTGHTTSAAGGVEAVISILALNNAFVPATLNHKENMPLQLNLITQNTDIQLNHVMSNSFGFGGNNSSIIFSKCI